MTMLYGVIGDPIAHSLSPLIHKGWMREHGLEAEYLAMQVPEGDLPQALQTLESRAFTGLNITLPHKKAALAIAGGATRRAGLIGAANTLWRPGDGTWQADNTDAPGFDYALKEAFGERQTDPSTETSNVDALVLGAGGAALAVAHVFGAEVRPTVFCNRTASKADAMVGVYKASHPANKNNTPVRIAPFEALKNELRVCAFVINATSLGHSGKSIDWPPGEGRLVYDLSYGRAAEAFLAPARAAGWTTVDGLLMLVAQAACSFEIWFNIKPNIASALARARRTLDNAG